jgi:hypothetical protein
LNIASTSGLRGQVVGDAEGGAADAVDRGVGDGRAADRGDEPALLEVLHALLPGGVASLDVPRDDATYFAQVLEYTEGFRTAVNLSWRPVEVGLDEADLGPALARRLGARVLWESNTEGSWSVAHPDGQVQAVTVVELDDGVTVLADA